MSDNLCGPSNAGKSLVTHAERDRTLHQDRFVNRQQAGRGISDVGTSFHNQHQQANVAAGEANYQEYLNSQHAPVTPAHAALPAMNGPIQAPNIDAQAFPPTPPSAGRAIPLAGGFIPGPMHSQIPIPYSHSSSPAVHASAGQAQQSAWISEFNQGQAHTAPSTSMLSTGMPAASMTPFMPRHLGFASPLPTHTMNHYGAPLAQDSIMATQHAGGIVNGITQNEDAEFSKAFDDFAAARFEEDVAGPSSTTHEAPQMTSNSHVTQSHDFQAEMDKWMAEHHPRNDTQDYYMDDMTATMQSMAMEQEVKEGLNEEENRKPQNDQEFKRAAASILSSVADNKSQKFLQSNFLALMKRIADEEIILQGEDLIETATGTAYKVTVEPKSDAVEEK